MVLNAIDVYSERTAISLSWFASALSASLSPQLSSSDILILWRLPHANNPPRRSGPDMKYVSGSSTNLDQVNVTEKVTKREKDTI